MGNCLRSSSVSTSNKEAISLPIDTIFKLPSPLPSRPSGGDFASGEIDLGGLQVRQVSSFNKVWSTYEGGPDDLGATVFEPSDVPDGFTMFGCYAQPNNQPLFGWVLVGKDDSGDILKKPTDYTLVWTSESLTISQTNQAYFWLPTPPDDYVAVGLAITTSSDKPSLDKIRCVRTDFSDECETDNWIWAQGTVRSDNGVNFFGLRPQNRGTQSQALSVGTFIIQDDDSSLSLSCLKNNTFPSSSMPNFKQIEALFETYSPFIYFHPKEIYLPSSVNWYFSNGALLYTKGEESNPVPIETNGSNLPQGQGGSDEGSYWLDLPVDEDSKEKVRKGDLASSEVYLHVKPMFGSTFTDIAMWIFYPFNGHTTAKLGLFDISLGHIGEHVGDWEHLTLRISNFDGVLYKVYFGQHSAGTWIDTSMVEFHTGNKVVAYAALNGHPFYPKPGLVLQGVGDIGLRNDTAKSDIFMDTGGGFSIVAAENLVPAVVEPPWLNYDREWGPITETKVGDEVNRTSWGSKIGFRYGSLSEDLYTGYRLQCEGWKSIFCDPNRPAFLGDVPISLHDVLNQNKRWAVGLLEVGFSQYSPLTFGIQAMGILMGQAYAHYAFWPIWSIPIIVYAFLPSLTLLNGIPIFPKVSDPWFLAYIFLFLGAYVQDCLDFILAKGTFQRWWNDQRFWLIRGLSSYLFGSIEYITKILGISTHGFNVTSKVMDDEQSKRYDRGIFEFGVESPLFVPLAMAAILNLMAFFFGGIVQIFKERNLDGFFVQVFVAGFGVLNCLPIYEAMFLRSDKGRMPTRITIISTLLVGGLCVVASFVLKI